MATISKALSSILFNAASLTLATAPWKNNVRAIYGFNPAGNGYQLFKPGSNFNSLTELVKDGVYIVDAGTLGFDIADALITVPAAVPAGLGAGPLRVANAQFRRGLGLSFEAQVNAGATDYRPLVMGLYDQAGGLVGLPIQPAAAGGSFNFSSGTWAGAASGTVYVLRAADLLGHTIQANVTIP